MCDRKDCPTYQAAMRAAAKIAKRFRRLRTLRLADWQAEANLHYVKAVRAWDGRGDLSAFVYIRVWRRLIDVARHEIAKAGRTVTPYNFETVADHKGEFQAKVRLLSDGGRRLAGALFRHVGRGTFNAAKSARKELRMWGKDRLARAFAELEELVS